MAFLLLKPKGLASLNENALSLIISFTSPYFHMAWEYGGPEGSAWLPQSCQMPPKQPCVYSAFVTYRLIDWRSPPSNCLSNSFPICDNVFSIDIRTVTPLPSALKDAAPT